MAPGIIAPKLSLAGIGNRVEIDLGAPLGKNWKVRLFDLDGKEFPAHPVVTGPGTMELGTRNLGPGLYLLEYADDEKRLLAKYLK